MEKDNLKEEDFDQELHEHFAFKIDSAFLFVIWITFGSETF